MLVTLLSSLVRHAWPFMFLCKSGFELKVNFESKLQWSLLIYIICDFRVADSYCVQWSVQSRTACIVVSGTIHITASSYHGIPEGWFFTAIFVTVLHMLIFLRRLWRIHCHLYQSFLCIVFSDKAFCIVVNWSTLAATFLVLPADYYQILLIKVVWTSRIVS